MRWVQVGVVALGVLMLSAFGCGAGGTSTPNNAAPTITVPTFNQTRAFTDLEAQVAFGPRNPGSDGHQQCGDWLVQRLTAAGATVAEQTFLYHAKTGDDYTGRNLIAQFAAQAGSTRQPLLLGAHWDTRPFAEQDPDPNARQTPILGANDGASGVAVLLELARFFGATPPPRPITVVLFDWEDEGQTNLTTGEPYSGFSIGARYYAANQGTAPPSEGIVLDMIGDANLAIYRENNSQQANRALNDLVWQTAANLGHTQFVDRVGSTITDDHLPLIDEGIAAIDLIDLDYPGPNDNSYWHTHDDLPSHCSASSLKAVGQTLLEVIYRRMAGR